jgi:hypothetical protein
VSVSAILPEIESRPSSYRDGIRANFTELKNQSAAREARSRRLSVAGFGFGDTQVVRSVLL